MTGKNDMKFNLKPAFTFVALCPLIVSVFLAACANAQAPQSFPANITKVNFTEVKDTPQNRQKYPFISDTFSLLKRIDATSDSKVSLASINSGNMKNIVLEIVEGPRACGIYCPLTVYSKTKDGVRDVKDLLSNQPTFLQVCPNETSLITTESYGLAQWTYDGSTLQHTATYPSLDEVPACGLK